MSNGMEKPDVRQSILDAARDLFALRGYDNTSMRRIAEKTDYTPTTIYLYFKDKSDLLHCICEETFAKLAETLRTIRARIEDPLDAFREGGRAYVRFALGHPNHYRVTFMTPLPSGHEEEEAERFKNSSGEQAFNFLRGVVADCVREGKFGPVDVETASQIVWASLHGLASLLIAHPRFPWVDRDQLIERTLDALTAGLKK